MRSFAAFLALLAITPSFARASDDGGCELSVVVAKAPKIVGHRGFLTFKVIVNSTPSEPACNKYVGKTIKIYEKKPVFSTVANVGSQFRLFSKNWGARDSAGINKPIEWDIAPPVP